MGDDSKRAGTGVSRRGLLYGLAGVAALVAGAGWAWRRRHADQGGQALPADFWQLQFDQPDGSKLAFESLKGRPLMLNFWATWCPPCIAELPLLESFYRQNSSNGLQIVGIAVDRLDPVRAFLQRQPLSYPVAMVATQGLELSRNLGNESGGLPFSVLINAAGHLVQRKLGQLNETDLRRWAQG